MKTRLLTNDECGAPRTIAHAVEILSDQAGFENGDWAQLSVQYYVVAGRESAYTAVLFNCTRKDQSFVCFLAPSLTFSGQIEGCLGRQQFLTEELDGARLDSDGAIKLPSGATIRSVEVEPVKRQYPTDLDQLIVHQVIEILGASEHCYHSLRAAVRDPIARDAIPDLVCFNLAALRALELPPLKVLWAEIIFREPTLRKLSQQKIADTLSQFGMRTPVKRPRHQIR